MGRVLVYGNAPWVPSGYGTQARRLGAMLRENGHTVAFAPFHGLTGAPLAFEGSTVFTGSGEDPWALDLLGAHYRAFQADLLITLMDAWVLDPGKLAGMNVAHWMPVDCRPLSHMDRKVLDAAGGRPVAMSRFGEKQMLDAGYDALYAPHSLDMALWSPLEDRDANRAQHGWSGKFVIGLNAANQDPFRKAFGEQIAAFAQFAKRHKDAILVIHSRAETRQGVDLMALISQAGVPGQIVLGDQYMIAAGVVTEPQMVSWHGMCDVVTNCSYGEGFGLAVLQAQACGTPVVVNDFSSMAELCGAGWKTGGQEFWNRGHNAFWQTPSVKEIGRAYEAAYRVWKTRGKDGRYAQLRAQAREFAAGYDSDVVYGEHWKPILDVLLPKAGPPPIPVAEPVAAL